MTDIKKTMDNLAANRMQPYLVSDRAQCLSLLKTLLPAGGTVAVGGSMTLFETGAIELLRSGSYRFLDRYKEGITPEEVRGIYLASFDADAYLCSANAITENGELYNVDGRSNRVAALLYGPKSVIVIAGTNKLVRNIDEAAARVRRIAAPQNSRRLHTGTYCESCGVCIAADEADLAAGCRSDARICCNYVISAMQRQKDRIKVILVDEALGY